MPRIRNEEPVTAADLADALGDALDDLEAWASTSPEGFTIDERRRYAGMIRLRCRYLDQPGTIIAGGAA